MPSLLLYNINPKPAQISHYMKFISTIWLRMIKSIMLTMPLAFTMGYVGINGEDTALKWTLSGCVMAQTNMAEIRGLPVKHLSF
jgi:hypothetical protein